MNSRELPDDCGIRATGPGDSPVDGGITGGISPRRSGFESPCLDGGGPPRGAGSVFVSGGFFLLSYPEFYQQRFFRALCGRAFQLCLAAGLPHRRRVGRSRGLGIVVGPDPGALDRCCEYFQPRACGTFRGENSRNHGADKHRHFAVYPVNFQSLRAIDPHAARRPGLEPPAPRFWPGGSPAHVIYGLCGHGSPL